MRNENRDSGQRFLEVNSIRSMEGEGNERKFRLSFSSEEPYERWFGLEILDHSDGCIDLNRVNSIGCVLFNHDRDVVVGKILRAWVENGRGEAEIEFDDDDESELICKKVKSGTLKGVSVGYRVTNWEDVEVNHASTCGRFTGPCSIAKRWMPYEISIVSVPADATVGVGRSFEDDTETEPAEQKGVSSFYFNEKQLQINKNLLGGK